MTLNIHEFLTHLEYLKDEAQEQKFQLEQQRKQAPK